MPDTLSPRDVNELYKTSSTTMNGIIKSSMDNKEYDILHLDNGMSCVIVQDKDASSCYANLSVAVGSFHEHFFPEKNFPKGTAHLLEHLLLLSSDKYPKSNEYSSFISNQGGTYNAHTSSEEANFHFDIQHRYFYDALDMFASFFIKPHFSTELCSKEIANIETEFERTKANDTQRMWHVIKQLASNDHPLGQFECGNASTLNLEGDRNFELVVEKARSFYETFYSGDIMNLCIICTQSIEEMKQFVQTLFSQIPNKNMMSQLYSKSSLLKKLQEQSFKSVFKQQDNPSVVRIVPQAQATTLNLLFAVPPLFYNAKHQAGDNFISIETTSCLGALLGSENQGSLLKFLRDRNLVKNISAQITSHFHDFSIFCITVNCTDEGISDEEKLQFIITHIFQAIQLYKSFDLKRFHAEMRSSQIFSFKYNPDIYAPTLALAISKKLFSYKIQANVLKTGTGEWPQDTFSNLVSISFVDPELNQTSFLQFLDYLSDIRECKILTLHKSNERYNSHVNVTKCLEPAYNAQFFVQEFRNLSRSIVSISPDFEQVLNPPPENKFLSKSYDIYPLDDSIKQEKQTSRLFFKNFKDFEQVKRNNDFLAFLSKDDNFEKRSANFPWDLESQEDMWRPPLLISSSFPGLKVWFKQALIQRTPKMFMKLRVATDFFAKEFVKSRLLLLIFDEIVAETVYLANKAGVNVGRYVDHSTNSLVFIFQGYGERISSISKKILSTFFSLSEVVSGLGEAFLKDVFSRVKESFRNSLAYYMNDGTLNKCQKSFYKLLEVNYLSPQEKLNLLESCDVSQIKAFLTEFKHHHQKYSSTADLFVFGNSTLRQCKDLAVTIGKTLNLPDAPLECGLRRQNFIEPPKKTKVIFFETQTATSNALSSIVFGICMGSSTPLTRAKTEMVRLCVDNKFFTEIRTNQAIAYNCFTSITVHEPFIFLKFCIESREFGPFDLQNSVEEFLETLVQTPLIGSEEEFFKSKNVVISRLLQNSGSVDREQADWWEWISNGCLQNDIEDARTIASIGFTEFNTFAKQCFQQKGSKLITGISCRGEVDAASYLNPSKEGSPMVLLVRSIEEFKEAYQRET